MVRPDRVELPTFWFVGVQSGRMLLILMPATTHFEANTWRTTAAIDERVLRGFPGTAFPNHFCPTPSSRGPARGREPGKTSPIWRSLNGRQLARPSMARSFRATRGIPTDLPTRRFLTTFLKVRNIYLYRIRTASHQ